MIVFLDTSTILSACWSERGLSRALVDRATGEKWKLTTADYCVAEVERNLRKQANGPMNWRSLIQPRIEVVSSVYVIDRPIVFDATKDRPVLLSAIGCDAEYLVTLDKADFSHVLGSVVYGVKVRTPMSFLVETGVAE